MKKIIIEYNDKEFEDNNIEPLKHIFRMIKDGCTSGFKAISKSNN